MTSTQADATRVLFLGLVDDLDLANDRAVQLAREFAARLERDGLLATGHARQVVALERRIDTEAPDPWFHQNLEELVSGEVADLKRRVDKCLTNAREAP